MYKKITVVLFAIMMFFIPIQNALIPNEADAFISKLLGISAKKVAKEVIKDMAVETAVDMALNEAFRIADAQQQKYDVQDAYKVVCLYGLTGEVCDKPVGIKENLTDADKIAIGHQAELELDKLITDGKGFTRWEKFLDWFGPLWVTALVGTALTYAFDSDTRSLFNEAGYNALVALGLITPVNSTEQVTPLKDVVLKPAPTDTNNDTNSGTYVHAKTSSNTTHGTIVQGYPIAPTNVIYQNKYEYTSTSNLMTTYSVNLTAEKNLMNINALTEELSVYKNVHGIPDSVTIAKNGVVQEVDTTGIDQVTFQTFSFLSSDLSAERGNIQSIITRSPYKVGESYYTDMIILLQNGGYYQVQIKSSEYLNTETSYSSLSSTKFTSTVSMKNIYVIRQNEIPHIKILVPTYPEVETEFDPSDNSSYVDEGGGLIAIVPPTALPHKRISTGEPLEVQPNPTPGGEPIYVAPDGTIVPEDDVEIGEPNISKSPEGVPQVTPQPTQNNPSPEPIPLTPTTPQTPPTPPTTPTPIETLPPVIPEGESCDVGLKLPRFNPLLHTISDAFPFSIPFDLKDGFDAIFAEMGSEKPEFDYKVKFMGDEQSWKITIPDYFDNWKAFTDSFLIFIFDVGIIYAIYRFMGGGN